MLKLQNIKKDYKVAKETVPALKGINLEFRDSEFVSILGPSGCGKTTLLNIIGGLDKYSDGDLIINGKSTKDYKDKDWDAYRNYSIGFVFQNYNLIPHLTVLGNVEMALTLSGISKFERKKRAVQALRKVGLGDKLNKKPKHLSGGQMQRVAIARAIVNNPDIILADEPTGALDTKTSVQIMEILKEISKDKLIIMVTHNPELANEYSNRIIRLVDGKITDDSSPLEKKENVNETKNKGKKKNKTAMKFFTALSLSFKNLFTKKARTILTAVAGSIGIIGVALVLSLSNGFQKYIDKMQADTLSSYPLMIEEQAMDISSIISTVTNKTNLEKFPSIKEVYINKVMQNYENMYTANNITDEYVENVIEKIDKSLINGIIYNRDIERNFYTNNGYMVQNVNGENYYSRLNVDAWQEMLNNNSFIKTQYDILEGRLPKAKDEIIIVVDQYNRLTDSTLMSLGLYVNGQEKDSYSFEELMETKFKLLTNQELYVCDEVKCSGNSSIINEEMYESGLTLNVVGIVRASEETAMGTLNAGIAYSHLLTEYIMEQDANSSLVSYLNNNINYDPFTGEEYVPDPKNNVTTEDRYNYALSRFGAVTTPTSIKIYPKDFESKNMIKEYLDNYNSDKDEINKIIYTDYMDLMIKAVNILIDAISYVLIAFTAISLIVSSIMIAIITYVSVIERTKEIGVLRSIGARKKDIARVFNAETFIIGLTAGLIGVCMTLILNIPINMIISSLVEGIGNIASLSIIHAILLVLISIGLTLLSGFIPARIASKKDPVEALRSE